MSIDHAKKIPSARIAVLGIITITVYGSWYYSFGVLLDPIISDTGWSEAALTSAFSASALVAGVGSVAGGWLLDRMGTRFVFSLAAVVASIGLGIATSTDSVLVFAVAGSIGGGALGALGFYHVTQTAAVRISPQSSTKAIAVLTIWGAFASAIFLPLAAWLVQLTDWRATLRILTASAVVALIVGAISVSTKTEQMPATRLVWSELGTALHSSATRGFIVAQGLVGISVSIVLVYQVPAMTAAGLTLTSASFWAGFRGFAQLGGRLPLMPIVSRLGTANSLRLAYAAIVIGMLLLTVASTPLVAAVFAIVAGFGIGASSPLVGMYSREVFGTASLGTAMGLLSLVFLVVGAIGPAVAGWIATATGSRALPVILGAVVAAAAIPLIRPVRSE